MTSNGGTDEPAAAPRPKSILNPDAPEFSPSLTRTSGKLNADAPEFIPGQLGSYDGGMGYVAVPDVKHGKGYPRPISQMYPPEGHYVPRWVPQHQQYVQMWMPYQPNLYQKNGMYDYVPYGYGGGGPRNFDGPEAHLRPPRGPKRYAADQEGHKRDPEMVYPTRAPHMPTHGPRSQHDIQAKQGGVVAPGSERKGVPPLENLDPQVNTDGIIEPLSAMDLKSKPLTWADRFRLSHPESENGQVRVEQYQNPVTMWKGRPSFADMMRKSANSERMSVENKPIGGDAPPANKSRAHFKVEDSPLIPMKDNVHKVEETEKPPVEMGVHVEVETTIEEEDEVPVAAAAADVAVELTPIQEVVDEPVEQPNDDLPVEDTIKEEVVEAPVVEETPVEEQVDVTEKAAAANVPPKEHVPKEAPQKVVEVEAAVTEPVANDRVYSVDRIIAIGLFMRRNDLLEDPKLIFSPTNVREGRGGGGGGNRGSTSAHYDDRSNTKQRGDHWNMQRRQAKSEGKGFSNGFRSSNMEFSRDQLEAVSLPRASESSWIIKQAKLKQDKEHQLMRRLMGLLNRLTVEKFDTIYKHILVSGVETVQQALMLVKIIFEKAITQHHFIPMYVELCAKLSDDFNNFADSEATATGGDQQHQAQNEPVEKKPESKSAKKSDFMRILLNCCQDSFESNLKPLEFPPELEGDDKFEFALKFKHRMRGNMIFVGELFKQKLLAAKLLITCLDQVFAKREEWIASTGSIETGDNHLEGMCTLLQTVGKSFDTDKWKYAGELEKRIQMLTDLGKNTNICFRIRCLIQNVLDSRHKNWAKSTPYKQEGPCRLDELRSKVLEEEKQQEENAWRNRRRNRPFDQKQPNTSPTRAAPNVLAAPSTPPEITSEELKRRAKGIVSELVLSHDVNEATLCITELKIPHHRDKELYGCIFNSSLEACARLTADRDRSVVAKWLADLAVSRSSHKMLISWLQGFLKDEPVEHGYSMMLEDYPVTPRMLRELLNNMKDEYASAPGFFEIASLIESETSRIAETSNVDE